jgi:hypothetical protein
VNSKEDDNSEDICPNYFLEFGLGTGCSTEDHLLSIIGKGRAGRRPGYDVFITTNCYSQRFHLLSCRGRRGGGEEEASSAALTVTPG